MVFPRVTARAHLAQCCTQSLNKKRPDIDKVSLFAALVLRVIAPSLFDAVDATTYSGPIGLIPAHAHMAFAPAGCESSIRNNLGPQIGSRRLPSAPGAICRHHPPILLCQSRVSFPEPSVRSFAEVSSDWRSQPVSHEQPMLFPQLKQR